MDSIRKWLLLSLLLAWPSLTFGQGTIPTLPVATNPLPSDACLYVYKGAPGVLDTKLCGPNWATAFGTSTAPPTTATISATGDANIDFTTMQNALNNNVITTALPGHWNICKTVTMPHDRLLFTTITPSAGNIGGHVATINAFFSTWTCNNPASFVTGAGPGGNTCHLVVNDRDYIQGMIFYGTAAAGIVAPFITGICSNNALAVECDHCGFVWMQGVGYLDYSFGGSPGFSNNYIQATWIHHSLFYANNGRFNGATYAGTAYTCQGDGVGGGGYCSDFVLGPGDDFALPSTVTCTGGMINVFGSPTAQIFGNRVEDGTAGCQGINFAGGSGMGIQDIDCDKIGPCIRLNNASNVSISGIRGGCCLSGSGSAIILFAGSNSRVKTSSISNGPSPNGAMYSAGAGVTCSACSLEGDGNAGNNTFADANSVAALLPAVYWPAQPFAFSGTLGGSATSLPTAAAANAGASAVVSDGATTATGYAATYAPGGATTRWVYSSGAAWLYH